ncbi:hypothetical protein DFH06DRAFT_1128883 [Mycena polygramma]|nr:hypothetical protein DFH06DRAFT_1128883 [Mycena polygramma]
MDVEPREGDRKGTARMIIRRKCERDGRRSELQSVDRATEGTAERMCKRIDKLDNKQGGTRVDSEERVVEDQQVFGEHTARGFVAKAPRGGRVEVPALESFVGRGRRRSEEVAAGGRRGVEARWKLADMGEAGARMWRVDGVAEKVLIASELRREVSAGLAASTYPSIREREGEGKGKYD